MAYKVNSNTFKNTNSTKKKKNGWIPFLIVVVLAILCVLINYAMLDFLNAAN